MRPPECRNDLETSDLGSFPGRSGKSLARPATRFFAASIDAALVLVPLLPGLLLTLHHLRGPLGVDILEDGAQNPASRHAMLVAGILAGAGALVMMGVLVLQSILLSKTGQSFGKRWLNIRIERTDGKRSSFGVSVVLRSWIPKLTALVPYVGWGMLLADWLFIYSDEHRCLHDRLAKTRVVCGGRKDCRR